MKSKRITGTRIALLLSFALLFVMICKAQERIGTVRQPLVGGSVIDAARQEEFGLVGYSDGSYVCSASLLRNDWVITAAHCVETKDAAGNPTPDPARPGQNLLTPVGNMTLTATWRTTQVARAVRVVTFQPYDIALIQVNRPFRVNNSIKGYSRLIFQDGQFPYFGEPVGADLLVFGQGISQFATGAGSSAVPSVNDGLYRVSYAKVTYSKDNRFWYPSVNGQMIAGGDSGGPSFAWVLNGYALVGVHSLTKATYVPGKPKTGWTWVTSTSEAADAPIAPVWDQIQRIIGPAPAQTIPALSPPPPGFIGTFGRTPPNYQPLWIYAIRPNGDLMWYRKDTNASAWQGPKRVATGWNQYKDVIAAGGNRLYALTNDGKLLWYQHDGFNDGTPTWVGPVEVASHWKISKIFSGGNGIVYAIRSDGALLWTRNNGFSHEAPNWQDFKVLAPKGYNISMFRDIFSTGNGAIYMIRRDILWDRLIYVQHEGYATGEAKFGQARIVSRGEWNTFQELIPCGDGTILALRPDGTLIWYRHRGQIAGRETWDGPVQIGSGWQDYGKVVALIPDPPPGVH